MAAQLSVHVRGDKSCVQWVVMVVDYLNGAFTHDVYGFIMRHSTHTPRDTIKSSIDRAIRYGYIRVDYDKSIDGAKRVARRYLVVTETGNDFLSNH